MERTLLTERKAVWLHEHDRHKLTGNKLSAASLISGHLNAPYGQMVFERDVIQSLKNGFLSGKTHTANDILAALFLEVSPGLILRCCREISASQEAVGNLYSQTVQLTFCRCMDWEEVFAEAVAGGW